MKKILLLLLLSVTMYGQVPADATPLENIQITNNVQDLTTDRVSVPTSDGVINWKYAKDLIIPAKAFLSTGLIKNGAITINGDPTKFNVTAGIGIVSNFDDPENPISNIVNFPAFNGVTPTYLNTGNITYIAINSTPAIVMQATPFTAIQRRDLIELGAVIHSNLTTINVINNLSSPTEAGTNQLHDLFDFIGALNLSGNVYSANGANLQLNKSAGIIGKRGVNFINNWKDPHRLSQAGETALTFRYRTQNGTEGTDRINLDPALYDLNNVLTAVPNNKFTIQTVVMFQTGLTRILYGQNVYDDFEKAKNAILTRKFNIELNSKENGIIRAYIIMRNTTTSLQNIADADIFEAQKYGGVASGGTSVDLAAILAALGYTPENVANKSDSFTASSSTTYSSTKALVDGLNTRVTTTGTTGNLQRIVGTNTLGNSALTDNGTTVVSSLPLGISGSVTGTSFIKSAATATNILLAGGTDITQASLFTTYLPQLESNATDLTVWNNGKGNVASNTSFGDGALRLNSSGGNNSGYGASSLSSNTTGSGNVGIGSNSLSSNISGISNTAVGLNSLQFLNSGSLNTAIGNQAGRSISGGAGNNTISNNSVFIGQNTSANANNETNQIVIGNDAIGAGSNTVTLGNTSITNTILRGAVTTNGSFVNSTAPATNALLAGGTTLANPISGTGTTGYLPKFTSAGVLGNSIVSESGSIISVVGGIRASGANTNPSIEVSNTGTSGFPLIQLVNTISSVSKFWNIENGRSVNGDLGFFNMNGQMMTIKENGDVNINQKLTVSQYKLSALNTAPTSATDSGTTGEIRITADFIYICIATNTWVRTALATW